MNAIEPNKPDITLSTGRVVRHTRMANGASHADMADGGDMSESEWEDYCGILARRNAVFIERQRNLRKQEALSQNHDSRMKIPASIPFGRIPDLRAHPEANLIALKPGKGAFADYIVKRYASRLQLESFLSNQRFPVDWYALIKTPVQRNMVIHPSFEKAIE